MSRPRLTMHRHSSRFINERAGAETLLTTRSLASITEDCHG